MAAGQDDFRYNPSAMASTIETLQSKLKEVEELSENCKSILRDHLMKEGITGATAERLIETFDTEVVKPLAGYSEAEQKFISQNSEVKDLADQTSQKNINIASM